MALPTLQPFWLKSYKNRNEGLLVRRNQFEADRREAWEKNARYFDRSNVETTKQRVWGSRESYQERYLLKSKNLKPKINITLAFEKLDLQSSDHCGMDLILSLHVCMLSKHF